MAVADLNCRIAVDYQARLDAARFAAETQFVADHQTALRALRDAFEQRGQDWTTVWE